MRARLDVFGVLVLAAVVGLTGGTLRDLLIGERPVALRDWHYLAAVCAAGLLVLLAHPALERLRRPIDVMDAAGLSLFCVTGAVQGLEHGFAAPEAVVLGLISGIGGGILRDLMVGEVPAVLLRSLYAVPALIGATLVVVAYRTGNEGAAFSALAATACFCLRLAAIRYDLHLPRPRDG